jgi:putative nucleotidyltransferase with HDIG domain
MTHRADMATTFVCGLMHDIGKAFLTMYFPDTYGIILIKIEGGERTSIQSESDVLGFTHTEVGAWLAQRWSFPKPVISAIANHHGMPEGEQKHSLLASILQLADHICLQERVTLEKRGFVKPLEGIVLEQLGLDYTDVLELRRVLAKDRVGLQSLA